MTSIRTRSLAAALLLFGLAPFAFAHVNYIDLSDPIASPGGVNGSAFSNFGWYEGTTTTLGNTHELAGGDFFKFHLSQQSLVSITFSDPGNRGLLNPAFSLYSGLLPDDGHDDAAIDPLNPRAATPPFSKIASPVDNGIATDAHGRVSPFRDTANVTFIGQFDALHDFSVGNAAGEWSVIGYVTHVDPAGGNAVALLNYLLPAGDYTIAASGGTACDDASCVNSANVPLTGLPGTVTLSVSAVPEPSTAWLCGGGLIALAAIGAWRRRGWQGLRTSVS
jgi:hypothetical protein